MDVLARLEISTQAKSFIVDAVQCGYGVLVPERMVALEGAETIAWWRPLASLDKFRYFDYIIGVIEHYNGCEPEE